MKKEKLSNYVKFISGLNLSVSSKFNATEKNIYTTANFDIDYYQKNVPNETVNNSEFQDKQLQVGDVVISTIHLLATIVTESNAGKILTYHYTKVEFINDELDKYYFVYLFNHHTDFQRQKKAETVGNSLHFIRARQLYDFYIPIIPIEKQKYIGQAYYQMMKLKRDLSTYTELLEKATLTIIKNTLKED